MTTTILWQSKTMDLKYNSDWRNALRSVFSSSMSNLIREKRCIICWIQQFQYFHFFFVIKSIGLPHHFACQICPVKKEIQISACFIWVTDCLFTRSLSVLLTRQRKDESNSICVSSVQRGEWNKCTAVPGARHVPRLGEIHVEGS